MRPLEDPPTDLEVTYDLHGLRCAVRPRAPRRLRTRLALGVASLGVTALALAVFVVGIAGFITAGVASWLALSAAGLLVILVLLAVSVIDSAEELDHYQVRLGEGWLVLRFADQGSEIRLDLSRVVTCEVDGPDVRLRDLTGAEALVPMGGHPTDEVLWLAAAIDLAVRDARRSDLPAPDALQRLLDRGDH